jgi:hypothetical protein
MGLNYTDTSLSIASRARAYFEAHPTATYQEAQAVVGGTVTNFPVYKKQVEARAKVRPYPNGYATRVNAKPTPAKTPTAPVGVTKRMFLLAYMLKNVTQPEKEVMAMFGIKPTSRVDVVRARAEAKQILSGAKEHPFKLRSKSEKLFRYLVVNPDATETAAAKKFGAVNTIIANVRYIADAVREAAKPKMVDMVDMAEVRAAPKTVPNIVTQKAAPVVNGAAEHPEITNWTLWEQETKVREAAAKAAVTKREARYELNFDEPKQEETPKLGIADRIKNRFTKARDTQVGGEHYTKKTVQPWDAMEAWMTFEQFEGFLRGNVIKYSARYKDKGGVEDLKKAQHYLARLIEHLETSVG